VRVRSDRGAQPRYLAVGMTDLPDHDDWLSEPEAERLSRFTYPKRRSEARLGRWTAKHAVAASLRVGPQPAALREIEIRNAADGAPEVFLESAPAPFQISMTDRADWAVCTVIGGDRPIGCDLELVEPRSPAFVADYFTPGERALVADAPHDHDLLANMIWSAKESALKVLRTGLRLDTRSVEVQPAGDQTQHEWSGLYVTTNDGLTFTGWWRRFGDFVLTYVSATSTEPPSSLVDPSPLHVATPSHAWTEAPRRMP